MGESPELGKLYTFHTDVREDSAWKGIRVVQAAGIFSVFSGKNTSIKKKEKKKPSVWPRDCGLEEQFQSAAFQDTSVPSWVMAFGVSAWKQDFGNPYPSLSEREKDTDRSPYIAIEWRIKEFPTGDTHG